ncbi:helix-turn-helix domain-containing protein [Streptomyces palmae]|nr:helix-turn-helix transcriptional regulator [Streptomyces palmae]
MSISRSDDSTPSTVRGDRDAELFGRRFRRLIGVIYPDSLGRPYTDTEIAKHSGLSNQYIGKLRKGGSVPSLANAGRLARLFGVSTDYFLNAPDHPAVRSVERNLQAIENHRAGGVQRAGRRGAARAPEGGAAPREARSRQRGTLS